MNRREALQALVAIPTAAGLDITQVQVEPDLQPGDLIAISTDRHVSTDTAERIRAHVKPLLRPGVDVLVLSGGLKLTVHRGVAKVDTP
jgi:hypothetical protein